MKVLFLSVTAGQGHNSAAKASMHYLAGKGVSCTMLDTIKYVSPIVGGSIDKGYLALTKISPKTLKTFFDNEMNNTKKHEIQKSVQNFYGTLFFKKLEKFIEHYKPDAIVCTHVFSAVLAAYVQKKNDYGIPMIGINCDFVVHPFWEAVGMDYYIVAAKELSYQAQKRGFPAESMVPIGIPIFSRFETKIPKERARDILGVENKTTLMIMSGSMGYGNIPAYLKELDALPHDIQYIVVCGNNKRLYKKLSSMEFKKRAYVYDYANNIEVMMDAADILLTKPGGITVSESLAKQVPLVLLDPIPGLEERNAMFLVNNGLAISCNVNYSPDEAVYHLLEKPERLAQMLVMQSKFGRPYAARDFGDGIIDMILSNNTGMPFARFF